MRESEIARDREGGEEAKEWESGLNQRYACQVCLFVLGTAVDEASVSLEKLIVYEI